MQRFTMEREEGRKETVKGKGHRSGLDARSVSKARLGPFVEKGEEREDSSRTALSTSPVV